MTFKPRTSLSEDVSWALRLVRSGFPEDQIVRALSRKHPRYGYSSVIYAEHMQSRGSDSARRYAERTVRKAVAWAKADPRVFTPFEARERLLSIWAHVDAQPWPLDLAGPRRALEAAFWIGYERGRVANMALDVRTHALRAGQARASMQRHRVVLDQLGWLKRNPQDRRARTSRFSFFNPLGHRTDLRVGPPMAHADRILNHDAFRPSAYGDTGWYLAHLQLSRTCRVGGPYKDAERLLEHLDLHILRQGTYNVAYRDWEAISAERARQAEARKDHAAGGEAYEGAFSRP